jgi:hypothetical protein
VQFPAAVSILQVAAIQTVALHTLINVATAAVTLIVMLCTACLVFPGQLEAVTKVQVPSMSVMYAVIVHIPSMVVTITVPIV